MGYGGSVAYGLLYYKGEEPPLNPYTDLTIHLINSLLPAGTAWSRTLDLQNDGELMLIQPKEVFKITAPKKAKQVQSIPSADFDLKQLFPQGQAWQN
jgi:hypothetical protein